MIVSFTGTRAGMSDAQRGAVERFLRAWYVMAFVHGDCVGSDDEADAIAVALGLARVLRPCTTEALRAHGERRGGRVLKVHAPEHPLVRDEKIVADARVVLVAPNGHETMRSGTWRMIRRAREAKKHVVIISPRGQTRHEGL
jgi:hypothetical protein